MVWNLEDESKDDEDVSEMQEGDNEEEDEGHDANMHDEIIT